MDRLRNDLARARAIVGVLIDEVACVRRAYRRDAEKREARRQYGDRRRAALVEARDYLLQLGAGDSAKVGPLNGRAGAAALLQLLEEALAPFASPAGR